MWTLSPEQSCFEKDQKPKRNEGQQRRQSSKSLAASCVLGIFSKTADGDQSGSTPTDPINLSTFGGKFWKQKVWSRFYPSRCPCPLSVHADGYFPNSSNCISLKSKHCSGQQSKVMHWLKLWASTTENCDQFKSFERGTSDSCAHITCTQMILFPGVCSLWKGFILFFKSSPLYDQFKQSHLLPITISK